MNLLKPIATLSGLTLISRILGLAREILMAAVLGATDAADACQMALRLPNFLRRIFAEGAFSASFIPTYTALEHNEGRARAVSGAAEIRSTLVAALGAMTILVCIFMPQLMWLIAPGFVENPAKFQLTVTLARIAFPSIFFLALAALYTGILNTYKRFTAGVLAPMGLNILMIVCLVFGDIFPTPMHGLSWSMLLAALIQWLWMRTAAARCGVHLPCCWPQLSAATRQMLRLLGPTAAAAGVIHVNVLICGAFLSCMIPGAVAAFSYADRLHQFPLSLIGVAISTVSLPALSQAYQQGDDTLATQTQNRLLEVAYFLILPAAVGLYILSEEIIHAVYVRGSFTAADAIETARVLAAFTWGLPAYVIVKIFSTSFFARKDTRTPFHATVAAVICNIILNFILVKPFGLVGVALATSLASWVHGVWLAVVLIKEKRFTLDGPLMKNTGKAALAAAGMGVLIHQLAQVSQHLLLGIGLPKFLTLGAIIGAGALCYGALLLILGAVRYTQLRHFFKRS